jgi:hypothetical protein
MVSKDIAIEIKEIFDQNELSDLKRFLQKRQNLNAYNARLKYLFHFVQSAGILTTTIAAGYDQRFLIWIGVGLNMLASLIDIYEKTNDGILKKLMVDINKIKDGTYVDEGALIDIEEKPSMGPDGKNTVTSPLIQSSNPAPNSNIHL